MTIRKTILVGFVAVLSFVDTFSIAQENSVSGSGIDVDRRGNIYICGGFEGTATFGRHMLHSKGSTDAFIAKYSPAGWCLWSIQIGGEGIDIANSVKIDRRGNCYVTGFFSNTAQFDFSKQTSKGNADIFIAKYNASGRLLWVKKTGGSGDDSGEHLAIDKGGNVLVTGRSGTSAFRAKYTYQGEEKYYEKFGGDGYDEAYSIEVDDSKNSFLTGVIGSNTFLAKYSPAGVIVWSKKAESINYNAGNDIAVDNAGNSYIVGNFADSISFGGKWGFKTFYSDQNSFVTKYDSDGKIKWAQRVNADNGDTRQICVDSKRNLYITGAFTEHAEFGKIIVNGLEYVPDIFIAKLRPDRKFEWAISSGSNNMDEGIAIAVDGFDNIYAIGNFSLTAKFGNITLSAGETQSMYVVKLSSSGKVQWATKAGEPDPMFGYDPDALYVDLNYKLLIGKEVKRPLIDQEVLLKDNVGHTLESTGTDDYGNFSFRNLDTKRQYDISVENTDSISLETPLFILNQKGGPMKELTRDANNTFSYEFLPMELTEISLLDQEDSQMQLGAYLKGGGKEITINQHIYYASGQWRVPSNVIPILKKIVKELREIPSLHLEVSSHTDAIGDDVYNMELSEKRANAIVDYFKKRHIPASKLNGTGYGETKIINGCVNGVDYCSEGDHQANRRTEFRFYKK